MIADDLTKTILITGASRGLGAALALRFARDGCALALCAQSSGLLEKVASLCRDAGAQQVRTSCVDVSDAAAVIAWVDAVESWRPIDIVIANAGVFHGKRASGSLETLAEATNILRVNVEGALNVANAAMHSMRARRKGRIVFISSLAALQPLADAPAYSASKAALCAYAEALREYLRPENVGVTTVLPGHITTAQTAHHVGRRPMEISANASAAIVARGILRGQDVIVFPKRLQWLIFLGRVLPLSLRARVNAPFRFHLREH